jgi:hypothetical protein
MDEIVYKAELEILKEKHKREIRSLDVQYGLSKAIYKKGDIIKEGDKTILIDKRTIDKNFLNSIPYPVYHGLLLKKDLTPTKRMERSSIYSTYQIELIKKAPEETAE